MAGVPCAMSRGLILHNLSRYLSCSLPYVLCTQDGTEDQRQRSLGLVNEGLEGLLPRASQLVQLGGSVFLVSW